jgi:hypothetical protein
MIRPWYRSRLFWLGIPGLMFLLWAWAKSHGTEMLTCLGASGGWGGSGYGKLMWFRVETKGDALVGLDLRNGQVCPQADTFFTSAPALAAPRFNTSFTSPLLPEPQWFPAPGWRSETVDAGSYLFLSLPYWLVTGLYGCAWVAGLVGWQWRKHRLHQSPAVGSL